MLNAEDINAVIDEIVDEKDFEKSNTKMETGDSIEELKNSQAFQDGGVIILDDLNEREMNNPRIQAMFKRSRHNNLSILIISWDYYELPKRTLRANGNIYHILKQNKCRDVQNLFQDNARMGMTLDEINFPTCNCWDEKYQPPLLDMSREKNSRCYPLWLNSMFVLVTNPLQNT